MTKREECFEYAKREDWKKCFRLAKGFDAIFSKESIDKIDISYECLSNSNRISFYKALNIDTENTIIEAKNIILDYISNMKK
jgi:hypothetical protein